ncbi:MULTISPECIES: hypothetical protein [Enterococcus]|uniref:hypothetical protein n=1 Tax=Enterococcus TaxID=1350 RepID=UPI0015862305|nr:MULTISPECIES: hypothetical protein [Enterococcus]GMG56855.1 hypothetical protein AH4_02820 [Enterococcus gallinarum]
MHLFRAKSNKKQLEEKFNAFSRYKKDNHQQIEEGFQKLDKLNKDFDKSFSFIQRKEQ